MMDGGLTEEALSRVFLRTLHSEAWADHYPPFMQVAQEVDCQQGRPDYVAASFADSALTESGRLTLSKTLSNPSTARILSLLKRTAPRTEDYLLRMTGLSRPVMRRCVFSLEETGFISKVGLASYTLAPEFPSLNCEMWAFELKLHHWQRALYQALQYQAFAHRVVVVIADRWAHRIERNIDRFKTLDVGVLSLNEDSGALRLINRPTKRMPASRFHYLYAMGKFLASPSTSLQVV